MLDGERRRRRLGLMLACLVPLMAGCANFFVPETNSGGSGGGTTVGGSGSNYAYILNVATQTVSGFLIGTGTLTATPGSAYSFSFVPQSAVVTRANNFLYVAGPGAIYAFGINNNGSLSGLVEEAGVSLGSEVALAVSPDGQWLFGLNTLGSTLDEWQINQTSGALTSLPGAAYSVTGAIPLPLMLRVSPFGDYVFAALGTGGDHVFTLDTSTGAVASSQHLYLNSTQTSDNSLISDSTETFLYIARSGAGGGVAVYTIGAGGALSAVTGSPFAAGMGTFDVALDSTGKYVYAANRSDGTISGYAIGTGGVLTALSGSPYASGAAITSLAADRSGMYLLAAAASGNPDLTMYSFDAAVSGKLDKTATETSGVDPAGSILVTTTH